MEEVTEFLTLLLGVWGEPGDICIVALEEIRDEDLVLVMFIRGGEDVGALDGLVEEAEDVVDVEEGFGGVCWTGDIWICVVSMSLS